jgi:hypothetical protein
MTQLIAAFRNFAKSPENYTQTGNQTSIWHNRTSKRKDYNTTRLLRKPEVKDITGKRDTRTGATIMKPQKNKFEAKEIGWIVSFYTGISNALVVFVKGQENSQRKLTILNFK